MAIPPDCHALAREKIGRAATAMPAAARITVEG